MGNRYIHGESGKTLKGRSLTYKTWVNIRKRKRENPYYRDVEIDPAWDDYLTFVSDVGKRPSSEHSIDRIDNSIGYVKGNVRWATHFEQCQNKTNNILVNWSGETLPLRETCRRLGWGYKTVWAWLKKNKSFEEIQERATQLWKT